MIKNLGLPSEVWINYLKISQVFGSGIPLKGLDSTNTHYPEQIMSAIIMSIKFCPSWLEWSLRKNLEERSSNDVTEFYCKDSYGDGYTVDSVENFDIPGIPGKIKKKTNGGRLMNRKNRGWEGMMKEDKGRKRRDYRVDIKKESIGGGARKGRNGNGNGERDDDGGRGGEGGGEEGENDDQEERGGSGRGGEDEEFKEEEEEENEGNEEEEEGDDGLQEGEERNSYNDDTNDDNERQRKSLSDENNDMNNDMSDKNHHTATEKELINNDNKKEEKNENIKYLPNIAQISEIDSVPRNLLNQLLTQYQNIIPSRRKVYKKLVSGEMSFSSVVDFIYDEREGEGEGNLNHFNGNINGNSNGNGSMINFNDNNNNHNNFDSNNDGNNEYNNNNNNNNSNNSHNNSNNSNYDSNNYYNNNNNNNHNNYSSNNTNNNNNYNNSSNNFTNSYDKDNNKNNNDNSDSDDDNVNSSSSSKSKRNNNNMNTNNNNNNNNNYSQNSSFNNTQNSTIMTQNSTNFSQNSTIMTQNSTNYSQNNNNNLNRNTVSYYTNNRGEREEYSQASYNSNTKFKSKLKKKVAGMINRNELQSVKKLTVIPGKVTVKISYSAADLRSASRNVTLGTAKNGPSWSKYVRYAKDVILNDNILYGGNVLQQRELLDNSNSLKLDHTECWSYYERKVYQRRIRGCLVYGDRYHKNGDLVRTYSSSVRYNGDLTGMHHAGYVILLERCSSYLYSKTGN